MTVVRTKVSILFTHSTRLSLSFLLKTFQVHFSGAKGSSLWSSVASTARFFTCLFDPLLSRVLSSLLKTFQVRFLSTAGSSLWSSVTSTARAFTCLFDPLLRGFPLHTIFTSLTITRAYIVTNYKTLCASHKAAKTALD